MSTTIAAVPMTPVESSLFSEMGYANGTLAVRYKTTGHVYHFEGVPAAEYGEVALSPSIGAAFNQRIRGKFPHTKATRACDRCGDIGPTDTVCTECGTGRYLT